MAIFRKMSNGWELAVSSLKVLNANRQLIVFPILSGISMLLITASIGFAVFAGSNWDTANIDMNPALLYTLVFPYYIVNYFVVVFFNMALIHCSKLYFDGEEVTVSKGLEFSMSRIKVILAWSVFSATVGVVLKIVQDNLGWAGKLITAATGIVWGLATFLVVPVLAYEQLGPIDAVKRSGQLITEKWGEGIGASFSFGLILVAIFLPLAAGAYALSYFVNNVAGIIVFVLAVLMVHIVWTALQSIFISALYSNINGNINQHFRQQMLDGMFEPK